MSKAGKIINLHELFSFEKYQTVSNKITYFNTIYILKENIVIVLLEEINIIF